ncbi:MAG TPA: alpha/beta fold hydrolase [Anaerolineae bacterium]
MDDLFIETQSWRVFGKSAGRRGDALVLGIHGWSQRNGWHTWKPMMRPLSAAGFWVVSVDMPGWGRSEPLRREPPLEDDPVAAILAILDGLEVETAVLMGKSWGGGVALDVALNHPQRVAKLVLTAPARLNLDGLAQLQQPVLLAWARDDPVIPYQHAAKFMNVIPDTQLETYATGGHSAAQKNVDDFAPKAIEFLKRKA